MVDPNPLDTPEFTVPITPDVTERAWAEASAIDFETFRLEERAAIERVNPGLMPFYDLLFSTVHAKNGEDDAYRAIGGFSVAHRILRYAINDRPLHFRPPDGADGKITVTTDLSEPRITPEQTEVGGEVIEQQMRDNFGDLPHLVDAVLVFKHRASRLGAATLFMLYKPEITGGE